MPGPEPLAGIAVHAGVYARPQLVLQQHRGEAVERRLDGGDLEEDLVRAPLLIEHLTDGAEVTLKASEAVDQRALRCLVEVARADRMEGREVCF